MSDLIKSGPLEEEFPIKFNNKDNSTRIALDQKGHMHWLKKGFIDKLAFQIGSGLGTSAKQLVKQGGEGTTTIGLGCLDEKNKKAPTIILSPDKEVEFKNIDPTFLDKHWWSSLNVAYQTAGEFWQNI